MQRILLPIVTGTLLLASVTEAIGGKPRKDDGEFDMSSTIELARENLDRRFGGTKPSTEPETATTATTATTEANEDSNEASQQQQQSTSSSDEKQTTADVDLNLSYDGSDLIEWIDGHENGYIHPDARIGLDPSGRYRGVFVKTVEEGGSAGGIEEGDLIAQIPWDLIVKPKNYSENRYFSCEAHFEMYRQFLLGDESPHAPYINYLKNQPRGRLVNEWTPAGKRLLGDILNHAHLFDEDDGNGLPPKSFLKDYEEIWVKQCGGEDDELARAAFYQLTSRDEDTLMVPFYDMHNHSNDLKKLNTITTKPSRRNKPFLMHSIKDIAPGEQILISYNRCHAGWADVTYEDCVSYSYYGTSELFNVFGFVEDFPQLWSFRMDVGDGTRDEMWDTLTFTLEASDDDDDDEDNDGYPLKVTFGDNYSQNRNDEYPEKENIKYLSDHLVRLRMLETTMKEDDKLMQTIPRYEWDMAWTYHEALVTAMSAAILASKEDGGVTLGNSEGNVDSRGLYSDDDDDDDDDDSEDDSEDEDSRDEL